MIIITDESKLHKVESKAESSGMLLEYEEDDYDSGLKYLNNTIIRCIFAMHI